MQPHRPRSQSSAPLRLRPTLREPRPAAHSARSAYPTRSMAAGRWIRSTRARPCAGSESSTARTTAPARQLTPARPQLQPAPQPQPPPPSPCPCRPCPCLSACGRGAARRRPASCRRPLRRPNPESGTRKTSRARDAAARPEWPAWQVSQAATAQVGASAAGGAWTRGRPRTRPAPGTARRRPAPGPPQRPGGRPADGTPLLTLSHPPAAPWEISTDQRRAGGVRAGWSTDRSTCSVNPSRYGDASRSIARCPAATQGRDTQWRGHDVPSPNQIMIIWGRAESPSKQRLDPPGPVLLGVVPGGGPGVVCQGVAVEHHRVDPPPA